MKLFIKIFMITFSGLVALPAWAQAPRITRSGQLILGKAAQKALNAYDKDFKIFPVTDFAPSVRKLFPPGELPMAVVADFNFDATADAVLMGKSRGKQIVLALLSTQNGYKAQVINQDEFTEPKTTRYGPDEFGYSHTISTFEVQRSGKKTAVLQLDSILAIRGSSLLIWDGQKFGGFPGD